ncbi:MAG: NAD-dependent epimerase/dehydratase family protein [Erythrobacter sp.]|uniref:NAD-dependent epimerase/dehydratase family protein n=1 Tax=Erythrobacter sp. TaxID=1042 RepID=UPI0032ECE076
MARKTALVLGAGGFIGGHLAKRLKAEGMWVRGVDLRPNPYSPSEADEFVIGDLSDETFAKSVVDQEFDEVYQLAADMGGAGYIFTGENDARVMRNSASINLNILDACQARRIQRVFFSSSACIYPRQNQADPGRPDCSEDSAYPADPDSEYGWEKLFCERLYLAYNRNYGMSCRIARYHNIFGPEGCWTGGREKAPAALCRKVSQAEPGGEIEIWGDGRQTRSFLHVDECIEGTTRLLRSGVTVPVNIGSEEMISINDLAMMVIDLSGKSLTIRNIQGPEGVRGRTSDNRLIREALGWAPELPLREGIAQTYSWIAAQVEQSNSSPAIGREDDITRPNRNGSPPVHRPGLNRARPKSAGSDAPA